MVLTFLNKHRHIGLLVLRIGIGLMFILHGAPKLFDGPEKWVKDRRRDGESGHRVRAGILGIHGGGFGVLWRDLSHRRLRFSTGLYPFDDNHGGCRDQPSE